VPKYGLTIVSLGSFSSPENSLKRKNKFLRQVTGNPESITKFSLNLSIGRLSTYGVTRSLEKPLRSNTSSKNVKKIIIKKHFALIIEVVHAY